MCACWKKRRRISGLSTCSQLYQKTHTFEAHLHPNKSDVFAANSFTGRIPSPSLARETGAVASEPQLLEDCPDPHEWSDSERSWLYSLRASTSSAGAEGTEVSGFASDFKWSRRGLRSLRGVAGLLGGCEFKYASKLGVEGLDGGSTVDQSVRLA